MAQKYEVGNSDFIELIFKNTYKALLSKNTHRIQVTLQEQWVPIFYFALRCVLFSLSLMQYTVHTYSNVVVKKRRGDVRQKLSLILRLKKANSLTCLSAYIWLLSQCPNGSMDLLHITHWVQALIISLKKSMFFNEGGNRRNILSCVLVITDGV
jgi:hypothetical protein